MRSLFSVCSMAGAWLLLAFGAQAMESQSDWQDHQGMLSTRVIAASSEVAAEFPGQIKLEGNPAVLLAWEAELKDGWKTYWRSPGEAGLPVRVFHSDDQIDILYPFPERFELFGLETYGYSKQVTIPFMVPAAAGEMTLKADFMVCKDICVPFEAEYTLDLDPETSGTIVTDTRIKRALATVPHLFGDVPDGIDITSVAFAGMPGHQNLIVEATADKPLSKADLLAELDETTQFHAPRMRLRPDGRSVQFVLPVMSTQKGLDLAGKQVRLTMSDGRGNAIDRIFELPSR